MSSSENQYINHFKDLLVPIHPAGYPFIAGAAVIALLLALMSDFLGTLGFVTTALVAFFFRDPERVVPISSGLIIAPADGTVHSITDVVPPAALDLGTDPLKRITIVLKLTDVHINRVPVSGKVISSTHIPGMFLNPTLDKASEDNERNLLTIAADEGQKLGLVQIAGLIGRRVVCDVTSGQHVKRGERFGMIRFGSRVDVYLPKNTEVLVFNGQRMVAGETVIAQFVVV